MQPLQISSSSSSVRRRGGEATPLARPAETLVSASTAAAAAQTAASGVSARPLCSQSNSSTTTTTTNNTIIIPYTTTVSANNTATNKNNTITHTNNTLRDNHSHHINNTASVLKRETTSDASCDNTNDSKGKFWRWALGGGGRRPRTLWQRVFFARGFSRCFHYRSRHRCRPRLILIAAFILFLLLLVPLSSSPSSSFVVTTAKGAAAPPPPPTSIKVVSKSTEEKTTNGAADKVTTAGGFSFTRWLSQLTQYISFQVSLLRQYADAHQGLDDFVSRVVFFLFGDAKRKSGGDPLQDAIRFFNDAYVVCPAVPTPLFFDNRISISNKNDINNNSSSGHTTSVNDERTNADSRRRTEAMPLLLFSPSRSGDGEARKSHYRYHHYHHRITSDNNIKKKSEGREDDDKDNTRRDTDVRSPHADYEEEEDDDYEVFLSSCHLARRVTIASVDPAHFFRSFIPSNEPNGTHDTFALEKRSGGGEERARAGDRRAPTAGDGDADKTHEKEELAPHQKQQQQEQEQEQQQGQQQQQQQQQQNNHNHRHHHYHHNNGDADDCPRQAFSKEERVRRRRMSLYNTRLYCTIPEDFFSNVGLYSNVRSATRPNWDVGAYTTTTTTSTAPAETFLSSRQQQQQQQQRRRQWSSRDVDLQDVLSGRVVEKRRRRRRRLRRRRREGTNPNTEAETVEGMTNGKAEKGNRAGKEAIRTASSEKGSDAEHTRAAAGQDNERSTSAEAEDFVDYVLSVRDLLECEFLDPDDFIVSLPMPPSPPSPPSAAPSVERGLQHSGPLLSLWEPHEVRHMTGSHRGAEGVKKGHTFDLYNFQQQQQQLQEEQRYVTPRRRRRRRVSSEEVHVLSSYANLAVGSAVAAQALSKAAAAAAATAATTPTPPTTTTTTSATTSGRDQTAGTQQQVRPLFMNAAAGGGIRMSMSSSAGGTLHDIVRMWLSADVWVSHYQAALPLLALSEGAERGGGGADDGKINNALRKQTVQEADNGEGVSQRHNNTMADVATTAIGKQRPPRSDGAGGGDSGGDSSSSNSPRGAPLSLLRPLMTVYWSGESAQRFPHASLSRAFLNQFDYVSSLVRYGGPEAAAAGEDEDEGEAGEKKEEEKATTTTTTTCNNRSYSRRRAFAGSCNQDHDPLMRTGLSQLYTPASSPSSSDASPRVVSPPRHYTLLNWRMATYYLRDFQAILDLNNGRVYADAASGDLRVRHPSGGGDSRYKQHDYDYSNAIDDNNDDTAGGARQGGGRKRKTRERSSIFMSRRKETAGRGAAAAATATLRKRVKALADPLANRNDLPYLLPPLRDVFTRIADGESEMDTATHSSIINNSRKNNKNNSNNSSTREDRHRSSNSSSSSSGGANASQLHSPAAPSSSSSHFSTVPPPPPPPPLPFTAAPYTVLQWARRRRPAIAVFISNCEPGRMRVVDAIAAQYPLHNFGKCGAPLTSTHVGGGDGDDNSVATGDDRRRWKKERDRTGSREEGEGHIRGKDASANTRAEWEEEKAKDGFFIDADGAKWELATTPVAQAQTETQTSTLNSKSTAATSITSATATREKVNAEEEEIAKAAATTTRFSSSSPAAPPPRRWRAPMPRDCAQLEAKLQHHSTFAHTKFTHPLRDYIARCVYARYRYVLVMENTLESHYVTEKLYNALFAGAIPILVGDNRHVRQHAPSWQRESRRSEGGGGGEGGVKEDENGPNDRFHSLHSEYSSSSSSVIYQLPQCRSVRESTSPLSLHKAEYSHNSFTLLSDAFVRYDEAYIRRLRTNSRRRAEIQKAVDRHFYRSFLAQNDTSTTTPTTSTSPLLSSGSSSLSSSFSVSSFSPSACQRFDKDAFPELEWSSSMSLVATTGIRSSTDGGGDSVCNPYRQLAEYLAFLDADAAERINGALKQNHSFSSFPSFSTVPTSAVTPTASPHATRTVQDTRQMSAESGEAAAAQRYLDWWRATSFDQWDAPSSSSSSSSSSFSSTIVDDGVHYDKSGDSYHHNGGGSGNRDRAGKGVSREGRRGERFSEAVQRPSPICDVCLAAYARRLQLWRRRHSESGGGGGG